MAKRAKPRTKKAAPAAPGAPASTAAPKRSAGGPMRVRATRMGFYDNKRVREGNVFTIASEADYSAVWMERVSRSTPENITTGQQALNEAHDAVLSDKLSKAGTGGANPLGAE